MPDRNTHLSNKINPTESINELIWTALTFSRPFETRADFSAACKALKNAGQCGAAEAVPFRGTESSRRL